MKFFIADTFRESLTKLPADLQKAAKTTAYDIQQDITHPSLQMHRLTKPKDPDFWSSRVSQDCRIILHRKNDSAVLRYVDRHDPAYAWAERRKLSTHPKTGAAQMVVISQEEQIIKIPVYVEEETPLPSKPPALMGISGEDLLDYGVPEDNIESLIQADEDLILDLIEDLPGEAAEAVLQLAAGTKPQAAVQDQEVDPLEHPDAQRRFRVMENAEELELALDYEWEKWVVFLHPAQRYLVRQDFNGPARVSGTAGTGKTVVALHRTVYLARQNESARILLTTFSDTLAALLKDKLRLLIVEEPRLMERIEVISLDKLAEHLYPKLLNTPTIASDDQIEELLSETAAVLGENRFTKQFIAAEWRQIVDSWQIDSWEEYRTVPRIGRKTRLPESSRSDLWRIFQIVKDRLHSEGLTTKAKMYQDLAEIISSSRRFPYDYAVVDEAQDVSVTQLRFLAALGSSRPDGLFFAGDLGQRIFQQPFSWLALGVDIRGRSRNLKVNYRTSHQIRSQADLLLDPEITDVDGNREDRLGTISVFNGSLPIIRRAASQVEEIEAVSDWIKSRVEEDIETHEIGVFVRSAKELDRARVAATNSDVEYAILDETIHPSEGKVCLGTMHAAKGLEFRAVAVMGCDYNVIPSPERIEDIADESDLIEVMNTERHLLYVACTRARDVLLVTGVNPVSEFLDDLQI